MASNTANPAAQSAALEALNAPIIQARRLASINAIASDSAAKHSITPAECMSDAVQVLAQIEGAVQHRAAVKKQRAARKYQANGKREVARRVRQAITIRFGSTNGIRRLPAAPVHGLATLSDGRVVPVVIHAGGSVQVAA